MNQSDMNDARNINLCSLTFREVAEVTEVVLMTLEEVVEADTNRRYNLVLK